MTSLLLRLLSATALLALPFLPLSADQLGGVSTAQEPVTQPPATIPEEFKTPDGLIDALYKSVTFGPGKECDYEMMEKIFLPGATFIMPSGRGEKRKIGHLEDFFADWKRFLSDPNTQEPLAKYGFNEKISNRRTDQFGEIAHSYVVFEVRFDPESRNPLGVGVDSIQMVRIDHRWWVSSINTQFARPNSPLPKRFLEQK
jgi:hypothetical protein